jgi:hypothetical protein
MTPDGLIVVQAMVARITCRWMTAPDLKAVSDSIDQAARLSARPQWERKASARAVACSAACAAGTRPGPGTRWNIISRACSTCAA